MPKNRYVLTARKQAKHNEGFPPKILVLPISSYRIIWESSWNIIFLSIRFSQDLRTQRLDLVLIVFSVTRDGEKSILCFVENRFHFFPDSPVSYGHKTTKSFDFFLLISHYERSIYFPHFFKPILILCQSYAWEKP